MSSGWQVVVRDPSCLSGTAFRQIAGLLASCVDARFVCIRDVEGAGASIARLSTGITVMTVDDLLIVAAGIIQIDWGDFFFCGAKSKAESISQHDAYAVAVAKADVTLRCVDDTFFYVYGTSSQLLSSLVGVLPFEQTKEGDLLELDYPD